MLGFLKKDLLIISKDIKIFLLLFIAMNIMLGMEVEKIMFITPFYMVTIILTTFGYEEKAGFYGYVSAIKNGRENLVAGKYLTAIILSLISILIIIVVYFVEASFKEVESLKEVTMLTLTSVFGALIANSFMLPFIFKLGVEKGRLFIFALFFGGSFGLSFILKTIKFQLPKFLINNGILLLVASSIIFFIISYLVSRKIVKNKDY